MEVNKQSKKITKKKVVKKQVTKMQEPQPVSNIDGVKKWTTLKHIGLVFPPPYTPHGVGIRYDGVPVMLTPDQEELATLYAELLDTHYVKVKLFNDNFFRDWKKLLGRDHVIKKLDKCDFRPIYEWVMMQKEKKKAMSTHEKAALRAERYKELKKYMPIIDGVKHWVGNYRVSPPLLVRGRGNKIGTFRRRIYPSDVIINIGKDVPIPESPIPGHSWKEVRHDNSVSWMACWKNPVIPNYFTYTFWYDRSPIYNHIVVQKHKDSSTLKNWFGKGDMLTRLGVALSNLGINHIAPNQPNEEDNNKRGNQANMSNNAPTTKVTPESCSGQTSMEEAALDFASLKISDWEIVKEEDLREIDHCEPMNE